MQDSSTGFLKHIVKAITWIREAGEPSHCDFLLTDEATIGYVLKILLAKACVTLRFFELKL